MINVTPEQKDAFEFLRANPPTIGPLPSMPQIPQLPRFSNPLTSHIDDVTMALTSVGGLNFSDMDYQIKLAVDKHVMTAEQADQITSQLSTMNISGVGELTQGAAALISQQTQQVVANLPTIVNTSQSVGEFKRSFAAVGAMPGTPELSVCDSINDLMGTLGEFGQSVMSGVKDALRAADTAISSLASHVKDFFSDALSNIKEAIQNQVKSMLPDYTGPSITSLVSSAISKVTSFASSIASNIKDAISTAMISARNMLTSLTDKIAAELANIADMFNYLRDAAFAISLPTLSPCAKNVLSLAAGAAGATALVNALK